ncbi:MAG: hypothetical protein AB1757_21285 [Acidobacteriota bacterium]
MNFRKILQLVLLFALSLIPVSVFAQTDAHSFAEGRVALDKYKDCPAALKAFEKVSEKGRNALWIHYIARTYECLKNYDKALVYYEQYEKFYPGRTEIIDKIAELRYLANKNKEESERKRLETERAKEAERLESEKKASEAAKLKKMKTDLSGTWVRSGNDKIRINQIASYVDATYAEVSLASQDKFGTSVGDLLFEDAQFKDGVLEGYCYMRYEEDVRENCDVDRYAKVRMRLRISDDGKTLSGKRDGKIIEYSAGADQCREDYLVEGTFVLTRYIK